jgi:hypothetical protein
MVRQLFELGILQSGFWHQFAMTAHSPVGMNPDEYGIKPNYQDITFANNDVEFIDSTGIDHTKFSFGLKKSLFNFMHGIGFDSPIQDWFDFKVPYTTIDPDYINDSLATGTVFNTKPNAKIVWLGNTPLVSEFTKTKRGQTKHLLQLAFHTKTACIEVVLEQAMGDWFLDILETLTPTAEKPTSFKQLKTDFETHFDDFELFWYSKPVQTIKELGLLVL